MAEDPQNFPRHPGDAWLEEALLQAASEIASFRAIANSERERMREAEEIARARASALEEELRRREAAHANELANARGVIDGQLREREKAWSEFSQGLRERLANLATAQEQHAQVVEEAGTLRRQLHDARSAVEAAQDARAELERRLSTGEEDFARAAAELQQKREEAASLVGQCAELGRELGASRTQAAQYQAEYRTQEAKLTEAEALRVRFADELRAAATELRDVRSERDQFATYKHELQLLRSAHSELETQAAARVAEAEARAAERLAELEQRTAAQAAELQARTAEQLADAEARSAAQVAAADARAAGQIADVEARAADRLAELEARTAAQTAELQARTAEQVAALEARAAAQVVELESRAAAIEARATAQAVEREARAAAQLTEAQAHALAQVSELQARVSETEARAVAQLAEAHAHAAAQVAELQAENAAHEARAKEHTAELQTRAAEELAQAQRQAAELQSLAVARAAAAETRAAELAALTAELQAQAVAQLAELDSRAAAQTAELESQAAENAGLRARIAELTNTGRDLEALRVLHGEVELRAQGLRGELAQMQARVLELEHDRDALYELRSDYTRLQRDHGDLRAELGRVAQQRDERIAAFDALREQTQMLQDALIKLEAAHGDQRSELEALNAQQYAELEAARHNVSDAEGQLAAAEQRISDAQRFAEKAKVRVQEAESDVSAARRERDQVRAAGEARVAELAELERQLTEAKTELAEHTQTRWALLDIEKQRSAKLKAELDQLRAQLANSLPPTAAEGAEPVDEFGDLSDVGEPPEVALERLSLPPRSASLHERAPANQQATPPSASVRPREGSSYSMTELAEEQIIVPARLPNLGKGGPGGGRGGR